MIFYRIAKGLGIAGMHLMFNLEITGKEHVPAGGGFVVACNHRAFWDPLFVARLFRRKVHFMAKAELFENPFNAFFLKKFGAFPVHRGMGDNPAIQYAVDRVKKGEILGIFPEGTRSLTGVPGRPRSGTVLVASQTGAPVLPVAISFSGKLRFRSRVRISVGALIPNEAINVNREDVASLKVATKYLFERITEML